MKRTKARREAAKERSEVKDFEGRNDRQWYFVGSNAVFTSDLNEGVVGLPLKCLGT